MPAASSEHIRASSTVRASNTRPPVLLSTGIGRGKYGIVRVWNAGRTAIVSEHRITAQQLATLQASANGGPPGVTQAQWESGLVDVLGMDFDVGDVQDENGSLRILCGEDAAGSVLSQKWLRVPPGEWSGVLPNITIPSAVLDAIPGTPLAAVANGVVERT